MPVGRSPLLYTISTLLVVVLATIAHASPPPSPRLHPRIPAPVDNANTPSATAAMIAEENARCPGICGAGNMYTDDIGALALAGCTTECISCGGYCMRIDQATDKGTWQTYTCGNCDY